MSVFTLLLMPIWHDSRANTLSPPPSSDAVKRLFIVHSYGPDNPTAIPQEQGALEALRKAGWTAGRNLIVQRFFMDTKKRYIHAEQIRMRGRLAREKIRAFRPDAVFAIDDNAFTEVAVPLAANGTPVVFSGINTPPEIYAFRYPFMKEQAIRQIDITGVYEDLHIGKALDVLRHILPLAPDDRIAVVLDTSPTGRGILLQVREALKTLPFRKQVDIHSVSTLKEYAELIATLNRDPRVRALYAGVLKLNTPDRRAWNARRITAWTLRHNRIPEMTLSFSLVERGYMGGIALNMREMGAQAGRKIARVLAGRPARRLPVEKAHYYALVFNMTRIRTLNVPMPSSLLLAADRIYE